MLKKLILGLLFILGLAILCDSGNEVWSAETGSEGSASDYRWLTEPRYEDAKGFRDGLWSVKVKKDGLWGFVDSMDNVVIDFQYTATSSFYPDTHLAFVGVGKGLIYRFAYGSFINKKGEYLFKLHSGLTLESHYAAAEGTELLPVNFQSAEGKYGYLNASGDVAIPAVYDRAGSFEEGKVAFVKKGNEWGAINTKGEWIVSYGSGYQYMYRVRQGYVVFKTDSGSVGLMDIDGTIILKPKYRDIVFSEKDMPFKLVSHEKVSYLDKNFNVVMEFAIEGYPLKDRSSDFGNYRRGIVFVRDMDKWRALDEKGNTVFEIDASFARPSHTSMGGCYLVYSSESRKRFLINGKGETILSPEFDSIEVSEEGIIAVKQNGLWGLLVLKEK